MAHLCVLCSNVHALEDAEDKKELEVDMAQQDHQDLLDRR